MVKMPFRYIDAIQRFWPMQKNFEWNFIVWMKWHIFLDVFSVVPIIVFIVITDMLSVILKFRNKQFISHTLTRNHMEIWFTWRQLVGYHLSRLLSIRTFFLCIQRARYFVLYSSSQSSLRRLIHFWIRFTTL